MSDEEKKDSPSIFEAIGTNFGKLFVLSMYQARATLTLAKAIENDPSSSTEMKHAAQESLIIIDTIIENLEEAVDSESAVSSIRQLMGKDQDEQR